MSLRKLREACEDGLADLPIPAKFSIPALVRNMEQERGRRILLVPLPDQVVNPNTACGLRVKAPDFSMILFRRRPTINQTDHVVLHELTHEWLDHGGTLGMDDLQQMLPVFNPTLLKRFVADRPIQARANYDSDDEKVAELGAHLIPRLARAVPSDDMLGRLGDTLAHPVGGRRLQGRFRNPFNRRS
ncbi:toxin [Streptomyces sp. NPDC060000]|uniref:toxin n=1 Tax=Streptomyces sp. NPDC060000 TaxID=3347031 RepID=UPI003681D60B